MSTLVLFCFKSWQSVCCCKEADRGKARGRAPSMCSLCPRALCSLCSPSSLVPPAPMLPLLPRSLRSRAPPAPLLPPLPCSLHSLASSAPVLPPLPCSLSIAVIPPGCEEPPCCTESLKIHIVAEICAPAAHTHFIHSLNYIMN